MKIYTQDNKSHILSAVNQLVDFTKPTFGPAANKVIIKSGRKLEVADDGVTVSDSFELENEFEQAIVELIREVSKKTNDRVGDGTTSSLIILQSLINEIFSKKEFRARKIVAELKKGLEEVKKQLTEKAQRVTKKGDLKKVAYIAFNNEEIAEVISEILWEVGVEGIVTIEESKSMETTHEIVKGLQFPRGFASPYFITDASRAETVLEKPYILVTDNEIVDLNAVLPLFEEVAKTGTPLLIVADDIRGEPLTLMILNRLKGKAFFVPVKAPYYSNKKYEFLMDLAELTGAHNFNAQMGINLKDAKIEHLGSADRVIINKDSTTIVGGHGKGLDEYVAKMRAIVDQSNSELDKDKMKERIAKLTSGVAVIKVGGATESEMRTLRFKVEDAVNATRVAFKSGIVPGAGTSLMKLQTSSDILNHALKAPHIQLLENLETIDLEITEDVVDPVEVLIAGIESAVSITNLLITTKGILVDKNESETNKENQKMA